MASRWSSERALGVGLALALAAGCHRVGRGGSDAETVEAGVPFSLGDPGPEGPPLTWQFGDKSAPAKGRQVRHAWSRAGRYRVEATADDGRVVSSRTLTVVPRPALRALPQVTATALFVDHAGSGLETVVDFLERLLGPASAQQSFERWGLPPLAIELDAAGRGVLDPEEAVGLFTFPGAEGPVGFLGVLDETRALAALAEAMSSRAAEGRTEPDGSHRYALPGERSACAFTDRGYLYVAFAPRERPGNCERVQTAVRAVRSLSVDARLQGEGHEGQVRVLGVEPGPEGYAFQGWVQLEGLRATLEGLLVSRHPLPSGGPQAPLLLSAPPAPVAALSSGVKAEDLLRLLAGQEGSAHRREQAERWRQAGLPAEALGQVFSGELAALAYFDAAAFFQNLIAGNERPEPRGALLAEAGVRQRSVVEALLVERLEREGLSLERFVEGAMTRYTARGPVPVQLGVGPGRAQLLWGTLEGSDVEPAAGSLAQRFGPGAFGPGHLSAMVDPGRLRALLARPLALPGLDPERFVKVQAFALTFFENLTSVDEAFLDLGPDPRGARLRGRLTLRPR